MSKSSYKPSEFILAIGEVHSRFKGVKSITLCLTDYKEEEVVGETKKTKQKIRWETEISKGTTPSEINKLIELFQSASKLIGYNAIIHACEEEKEEADHD